MTPPTPQEAEIAGVAERLSDPMERLVAEALGFSGIDYLHESAGAPLDFWLVGEDIHIEVKRLHSPRIAAQMARVENVIAVQGKPAVEWFVAMIRDNAHLRRELAATTAALAAHLQRAQGER
jgi:hypothetical protein